VPQRDLSTRQEDEMRPARVLLVTSVLLASSVVAVQSALSRDSHGLEGQAVVIGTGGPDVLVGSADADLIRGWSGDDRLSGLDGDDVLYGGRGDDVIDGGPGRDTITCGPGSDRVIGGDDDAIASDCEQVDAGGVEPAPAPTDRSIVLVDRQWRCTSAVDLDLVKVTMHSGGDAISIASGCSGRIGRVEVDTWAADGIKVQNAAPAAADLVVEGGYVECHALSPGSHQDGVQAMGGSRLTFRNLTVDCLGNSNFYVNRAGSGASTPTDVVCDGCVLGPRSASTLFIGSSVRSGARNSFVCEGRYFDVRIERATAPVSSGLEVIPAGDARCR
jgi:Ca2+-binding RTX toxin-like protein